MRGFTSQDQVSFFPDKEKKLIEGRKWPPEFEEDVDMSKVNLDVISTWIQTRLTQILGVEDDIIVAYCRQQLLPVDDASDHTSSSKRICPKKLTINMTGFLNNKKAAIFVKELWLLLLDAQSNPGGIPQQFIDDKTTQLQEKQEEAKRVKEALEKAQGLLGSEAAAAAGNETTKKDDEKDEEKDVAVAEKAEVKTTSVSRSGSRSSSGSARYNNRRRSPPRRDRRSPPRRGSSRGRRCVILFLLCVSSVCVCLE